MKYVGRLILGITFLLGMSANAVSAHLEDRAERLASQAEELASKSYSGFNDRDRGNRADVEVLYLTQQFSSGASLFPIWRAVPNASPLPGINGTRYNERWMTLAESST